tara:strand:+ start:280 stop:570 length:291 start_codon:yes stop_codon:yes gene_type:complete
MECSILCGKDIFVAIYDKDRSKMIQYRSTPDFTAKQVDKLVNTELIGIKEFSNEDFIKHFASEYYKNANEKYNKEPSESISDKELHKRDIANSSIH